MDWLETLRQKQLRLAELREEVATLEAELRDAKAILAGKTVLGQNSENKPKSRHGFVNGRRQRPIQQGSSVWLTLEVLRQIGHPLPIDDILLLIETKSKQKVKKNTLVSNLSRYVKHGDTFTRPAPSVFGLKEFEQKAVETHPVAVPA